MNHILPGTPSERLLFAVRSCGTDPDLLSKFCGKRHDPLLDELITRLEEVRNFIDYGMSSSILQGLQDRGVDVLLDFSDRSKVAISLRSPFDLRQPDFARSTKAQITEGSTYPDLEAYLLILCPCPDDRGVMEKCRAMQAFINQSNDAKLDVMDPSVLAAFLFSETRPTARELDQQYRGVRTISIESSSHELFFDNRIRVRYLLCRDIKEARKLLLDGVREHFPLPGPHSTVPTPALTALMDDAETFASREIGITETIARNWDEIAPAEVRSLKRQTAEGLAAKGGQGGLGMRHYLQPSMDEPIVTELLTRDPLISKMFAGGEPLNQLVQLYAFDEPCGGGGVQVMAQGRPLEVVVLEITATREPVHDVVLYMAHQQNYGFRFTPLEQDADSEMQLEEFPYPPRTLLKDESILVPLAIGLGPFGTVEGETVRTRSDVFPTSTVSGQRYDHQTASVQTHYEAAVTAENVFRPVRTVTRVSHFGFRSSHNFFERVLVRTLNRSNLLYVNSWLRIGCCPFLVVNTRDRGWCEMGSVLDVFVARPGTDIVQLPNTWSGQIKIQEREDEETCLLGITIEWTDAVGNIRHVPLLEKEIRLRKGQEIVLDARLRGPVHKARLFISGYYGPVGNPISAPSAVFASARAMG